MKNKTTVLAAEEQIYARDVMESTRLAWVWHSDQRQATAGAACQAPQDAD
jgi:hypothetical protein